MNFQTLLEKIVQTRKIPRNKFSNNLDSNNFPRKQSEKIQNILPVVEIGNCVASS